MHTSSKVFYLILLLLFMLPNINAVAEDKVKPLFNSNNDTKTDDKKMHSMSWNVPKPKKEETTATKTDETENKADPEAEAEKKELTADEKLWKKYKALAEGSKPEPEDKKEDQDELAENEQEFTPEETSKENEEKAIGLQAIIEDYKKSQASKGNLNSRSFGNID